MILTWWVPLNRRARFCALFTAPIPLAGMIGGALGVFAYLYLTDGPSTSKWLPPREKEITAEDVAQGG